MRTHHRHPTPRDYERYQAITYARWIARRDGIELPPGRAPTVVYDYCYVGRKEERRPRAVIFGDARMVTVDLPHWNHVPRMTVHHDDMDGEARA